MNRLLLFLIAALPVTGIAASEPSFHLLAAFNDWKTDGAASVVWHRPVCHPLNPILTADRPWELNMAGDPYAAPFSGGVWLDGDRFRMWYSAGGGKRNGLITCYAESPDGVNWVKPELDVVPGTNIVDTLEHDCVTVLLDRHEKDAARRYKMFCVAFNTPSCVSMVLKYSPDGIHWSEPQALSGELYDRCSAYYDEPRGRYVLSLKHKHPRLGRTRNYLAAEDPEMLVSLAHRVYPGMTDKNIRYWFNADSLDERHPRFPDIRPQIYNHDATAYAGGLLGQFVVWKGPENGECNRLNIQKRNEICLGWSDDGFHWKRPDRRAFIGVNDSVPGAWNAGNVQSVAGCPVVRGDSLYFYFSGRAESKPVHASNFSTGLATMRRDGFASIRADSGEGKAELSGAWGGFPGASSLYVNARSIPKGGGESWLRVEFLDGAGKALAGYETDTEVFDSTALPLRLVSGKPVDSPEADAVRSVRVTLRNAELFSLFVR